jgi:hypothetical protein
MRLFFGSSLSSSSKQKKRKKKIPVEGPSQKKLREKKKSFEMMVTSTTTTTTEVVVAFAASSSNRTRRRSSLKASTSNRCCQSRSSSTFSSSQSGGGGWNKKNTKRIETTKTFFACSATPSGSGNEKDKDEKNDNDNDNNNNNNPFKSVQEIDDYIINPKEITDLIDSDPNVLKEIEKLKAESKKVASEAIEKLKTSNENELRETFKKTTDRVVSAQSEAESAAMDELKIQEERMRRAEENLRKAAEETKRLREEGLEGSGGNEAERRQKKDLDRIESAKAGTISAIGGVLLSLPLALSQFSGNAFNQFADVGATALSCALFGIVYRYAVRENIDDFQLKGGVVGAFGLVRGVGQAEVFMDVASNNGELSFAAFAQAAAICGESVLVFLFAGLCVEAAMTREFVARKSGKE